MNFKLGGVQYLNICILLGEIVSEIEFQFIINSKNKSIAYFDLELLNKSIIKVRAYNEIADYIYSRLSKGDIIVIEGKVRTNEFIEIEKMITIVYHCYIV